MHGRIPVKAERPLHVTTHVVCLQLLVPGQTRAFLPRPHASVPRTSVCLFRCGHVMSQAHTYDWTYWVMVTVSDSGEGAVCLSPLHVLSTPAGNLWPEGPNRDSSVRAHGLAPWQGMAIGLSWGFSSRMSPWTSGRAGKGQSGQ